VCVEASGVPGSERESVYISVCVEVVVGGVRASVCVCMCVCVCVCVCVSTWGCEGGGIAVPSSVGRGGEKCVREVCERSV
jgi:hypothetical protein